jgi:indolepyruvate ferredoxin oxidoreductase
MRHTEVTLDDKFLLNEGRVFITGVQALLRVLMDQRRLDEAAGLNTTSRPTGPPSIWTPPRWCSRKV